MNRRKLIAFVPTLAILLTMAAMGFEPPGRARVDQAYFDGVSDAIAAIPYRIGSWIGADVEAQEPAVRLLRPNKLMQRRFLKTDGSSAFSLLFVHCSDARDMQGHYPPVCYPAHGWVINRAERAEFALGTDRVPSTVYHLSALRQGDERTMTILNFFAVPSEQDSLAADMAAVNRASATSARSGLGAAQIQLIVTGHVSVEEMTELAEEVGAAIEPPIRKVIHGVGNDPV